MKRADEQRWRVKNEQGETFGPVGIETLQAWARDGRLSPSSMVSVDAVAWTPVNHLHELEMDWVVEVSPGALYGPIHRQALEGLLANGTVPPAAVCFVRDGGARAEEAEQALAVCVEQAEQAQAVLAVQVSQLTAQLAERDARLQRLEQQAADFNALQLLAQHIQVLVADELAALVDDTVAVEEAEGGT